MELLLEFSRVLQRHKEPSIRTFWTCPDAGLAPTPEVQARKPEKGARQPVKPQTLGVRVGGDLRRQAPGPGLQQVCPDDGDLEAIARVNTGPCVCRHFLVRATRRHGQSSSETRALHGRGAFAGAENTSSCCCFSQKYIFARRLFDVLVVFGTS